MTKYVFAKNINDTNVSGIVDVEKSVILCYCNEDDSKVILPALNISSNVPVMRSLPKRKPFKKWTADEYDMAANAVAEAMKLTSPEWGIIRYAIRKAVEENS